MSQKPLPQPSISKNWKITFATIWTGQAFSLLGSQLVQFALVWYLTQETGSATVLAAASLIGVLPQILTGPLVGALVDRWNRRLIMIAADSVIALAVVVLAALFAFNRVEIWHIFVLMFLRSLAGGFHWPAMQASTSLMVPREHLSRVQGFNQMLYGLMAIAAPPFGALLLGLLPMQGVLAVDVGTAMLAILPLLFITIPQPTRTADQHPTGQKSTVWEDLRAGFRYVSGWPGLLLIGLMATLINMLLTPAMALMPILITRYFQGNVMNLASMNAAWGIGSVVGGILLGIWGGFHRRILTSMVGLMLIGGGMLAIGLVPANLLWLAVVMMFIVGVGGPVANGPLMAVVQAVVEPEMQGRVLTLISSASMAMSPLGLMFAGPLADHFNVQIWFIVGGIATMAMGIGTVFIPAVMYFEDGRKTSVPAAEPAPGLETQA